MGDIEEHNAARRETPIPHPDRDAITKAVEALKAFGDDAPIRDKRAFAETTIAALSALQPTPAREEAEALVKKTREHPSMGHAFECAAFIAREILGETS